MSVRADTVENQTRTSFPLIEKFAFSLNYVAALICSEFRHCQIFHCLLDLKEKTKELRKS